MMSKFINKQSSVINMMSDSHKHIEISINNNIEILNSIITTELSFGKYDNYINNNSKLINSFVKYILMSDNETIFVYNSKITNVSNTRWIFDTLAIPLIIWWSLDDPKQKELANDFQNKLLEKLRAI